MTLDFLDATPAGAPPARGPLTDPAEAAGATLEQRDGWLLASSFGDPAAERSACAETVGFADRSHLTKLELQGPPAAIERAVAAEGGWRLRLTPARALLIAEPGTLAEPAGAELRCCDLTASWGALTLAGPAARDLLARFCALDTRPASLPVGEFRPGSIGRTPGLLLREDEDRFLVLFGAAFGAYFWEIVADAASRLGGRPVGLDALAGAPAEAPHA